MDCLLSGSERMLYGCYFLAMPTTQTSATVDEMTVGPEVPQTPQQIADAVRTFLEKHREATVLEDGKAVCELGSAQFKVSSDHGRCTLQLWNNERNLVRTLVSAAERNGSLRLRTKRFGHSQTKLMQLVGEPQPRTRAAREPMRKQ